MRICILSRDNTPLGFLDNNSPDSLHFYDDKLHIYLEGTAHTFEFTVNAQHEDSYLLEVGNKCSFIYKDRPYYMTIMTMEQTETKINVEAWSTSLELLNEQAIAYTAPKAMSFEEYLKAFLFERRMLTIGINEVSDKKITNEWTGENDTVLKRLFSLANVFDAELEFVPVLNRDYSLNTIQMNVWRAHSDSYQGVGENRQDMSFRYGVNVQGITKKEDISDLYTCIRATGKDDLNIQSLGYKEVLDANGNIEYVHYANSGEIYAPQARDRFPSNIVENGDKYICYQWSTEYTDVNTLYSNALAKLKEICVPNTTYEIKGYIDVNIGDTVTVIDEGFNPPLYLSTRVTEQEISTTNPSNNSTIFDNTTELESQIDDSLIQLQKELKTIKAQAEAAQSQADTASSSADTATQVANAAQENAQESIDKTNVNLESYQVTTDQSIEALQQSQAENLTTATAYTDDELNAYKEKVASKIDLDDDLTLGANSNAKVTVGDNIVFTENNTEVAKVEDGKLQITEASISEMQLGSIRFHVRADGSVSVSGGDS